MGPLWTSLSYVTRASSVLGLAGDYFLCYNSTHRLPGVSCGILQRFLKYHFFPAVFSSLKCFILITEAMHVLTTGRGMIGCRESKACFHCPPDVSPWVSALSLSTTFQLSFVDQFSCGVMFGILPLPCCVPLSPTQERSYVSVPFFPPDLTQHYVL